MATPPYSIVSELLDRVQELSHAVNNTGAHRNNEVLSETPTQNTVQNTSIQQEVCRVFNRPPRRENLNRDQQQPIPQSTYSTRSTSGNQSRPIFGLRRNFSGRQNGSKPKKRKIPSGPFLRDVVLLTGPNDKIVPRQGNRVWLSEHGHILTGFQFYKEWNAAQVEIAIKEAFEDKIPSHTDFEILASVHSSLVVPTLAPGQSGLDGMMIHRIFKAKPVYVRPVHQIVNPGFLPSLHNVNEVLYAHIVKQLDTSNP